MNDFANEARKKISSIRTRRPNCAYSSVQPINVDEEREKFLKKAKEYECGSRKRRPEDPIFEYADSAECEMACPAVPCSCSRAKMWEEFGPADDRYIEQALKILNLYKDASTLDQIDVVADAQRLSPTSDPSGRCSDVHKIEEWVRKYLEEIGVEKSVEIVWMDKSKCRSASMISTIVNGEVKGKLHLVKDTIRCFFNFIFTSDVPGNQWTRLRFQSLMDHEIGTHFVRAHNNQKIVNMMGKWTREAKSPIVDLITEEGLASLNTLLKSRNKLMWSPALSYYSQCRARELGFTDLFLELKQYVSSPEARWSYCLRCKRGLRNSALPGSLGKDRAYLEGAIKILQRLNDLDFVLLHSMKVSLEDYNDAKIVLLRNSSLTRQLHIPSFLSNIADYKESLKEIARVNLIDVKEKKRARSFFSLTSVGAMRRSFEMRRSELMEKNLDKISSLARKHADLLLSSAKQNRKKTRQAVIARCVGSSKREENRNAILDECFKQRQKSNKLVNAKNT
ncbi:hypothetical protein GUITHDRAFT_100581 [Guillardia theta CCMP2712]|uniref:Uncharacterized protein n=1 Tax=Guillardia theta (strain CCMP2712) TaxID=905079 RepID=L1JYY9_GUITC|nr:hypothetical protein GUITHDRAFT_100581 [Guillardia theta CCMP2712]EKX53597.1 hypothetical protein GUITHDRAFT_100581 [Guillardia theta CCMP2712]|eukprot:XP_005840577.1 hypothetical protein GUITHDRAFT_100581 [Guillardia theta CCMP2712]